MFDCLVYMFVCLSMVVSEPCGRTVDASDPVKGYVMSNDPAPAIDVDGLYLSLDDDVCPSVDCWVGAGGDGASCVAWGWYAFGRDGDFEVRPTDHCNVDGLSVETRGNGVWSPVCHSAEEGSALLDVVITEPGICVGAWYVLSSLDGCAWARTGCLWAEDVVVLASAGGYDRLVMVADAGNFYVAVAAVVDESVVSDSLW